MKSLSLTPDQRKSFLVNPERWCAENNIEDVLLELTPILRSREESLNTKKSTKGMTGSISKEIGIRKKNNKEFSDLISEMESYKKTLDELTKKIKNDENNIFELITSAITEKENTGIAPPSSEKRDFDYSELKVIQLPEDYSASCQQYLLNNEAASIYHSPEWCKLIKDVFGHDAVYLIALINAEVVGVLPVVVVNSRLFGHYATSMPYFNYGGVVASSERINKELIGAAEKIFKAKGVDHVEYRCLEPMPSYPGHQDKVSMWLSLPSDPDQLWKGVGSKVRAQIKKAKSHGFQLYVGGEELLDDFYDVFAVNMRDLGTPVYSKGFFKAMLASSVGDKKLVVLKLQGRAVSASFLLGHAGRLEVPWASTLKKYNHHNANMLLYWHMLEYACSHGYKTFDFGRSSKDAATYRFKKQWGAKPVQLYWNYFLPEGGELPGLNTNNPKYKLLIGIWKKMPVWLTRIIGPQVVKNLP